MPRLLLMVRSCSRPSERSRHCCSATFALCADGLGHARRTCHTDRQPCSREQSANDSLVVTLVTNEDQQVLGIVC